MKYSGWKPFKVMTGKSQSWPFVMLTTASVVMHGVVLGLPWPEAASNQEVEVPPVAEAPAVNVTVLPPQSAVPAPAETASAEVAEPPAPAPLPQPAPEVARSPQPASPPVQSAPPEPSPQDVVPTEPTAETPPTSADPVPNPLDEPPVDPGARDLTEPEPFSPPPLEQQLQDPTAYQYDGYKSLGFLEVTTALQGWSAAGQALPSKVDPLTLPYQLGDQCLDEPPVLGLLVAIVDQDGTFVRGPEVISSTGYTVLDEQAIALVTAGDYTFPERDQPQAYSVEVAVQYPQTCQ